MAGVWYRIGTIGVTAGSKKITGAGTAWAGAQNGVAKGTLLLIPNGTSVDIYEIDYVESNTVLWLVDNYRGTTGTGKSYAIDITRTDSIPDFSRRLAATLSYHQANLDVLQQLYTSSAASITVTAPDGTQRTAIPWPKLEQLASRTLTEMGAGSAATRNVGTAAGNLMEVGAFGLGSTEGVIISDWNNAPLVNCILYATSSSALNKPPGGSTSGWQQVSAGGLYIKQYGTAINGNVLYSRVRDNLGVWSDWIPQFNRSNILGAVSQISGVPTGAIIERGSNSDGEYVKYADGTMECWGHQGYTTDIISTANSAGGWCRSSVLTFQFPVPFAETGAFPSVSFASSYLDATNAMFNVYPTQYRVSAGARSSFGVSWCSPVALTAQIVRLSWIAKGRWF